MDIGTAKPFLSRKSIRQLADKSQKYNLIFKNDKLKTKKSYKLQPTNCKLIKGIPHYLIDIINPDEDFSVAEYKKLAVKTIRDIQKRGKIPILVGGTGLYISAIVDNIEIPKVKPNQALRKKLEKTPIIKLLKQLKKSDPATFRTIDKKNKRRIIRALEVLISTGKLFSAQKQKGAPLFDILEIGIDIPREKLYKKIDARVEKMIKTGLVQETKKLSKKYSWKLSSMSGIGYKQIGMYLRGALSLEKAEELIKFATHAYARRQMTWLRRDKRIKWVKADKSGIDKTVKLCKRFLKN